MTLLDEALTDRPFPQLRLLSEHEFASFLQSRGIDVGIRGVRSLVESGLIESLGDEPARFHAFQIWPICSLFRLLDFNLDAGISHHGLNPEGLKHFIDINWRPMSENLPTFPKSDELVVFNRQILPLLLWIESYFLPAARGSRADLVTLVNANGSIWSRWKATVNFEKWLCSHSLSIERLFKWREHLLLQAFHYDPNPDLYLLLRSMPFDKRDRFKGQLRLAYDLYEIAEITRLFLEQVTDRPVSKEWDPTGHPSTNWVERLYGSQPKFGAPEFLRPLIRHHGLDPAPRVRWLVEGETEEGFIVRYAERLRAPIEEYATVTSIGGDGTLRGKKHLAAETVFLETAREEQCFAALTFDTSPAVRTRIEGHLSKGLITLCFLLNDADFERQNFITDELVTVAIAISSETPHPIKLSHEVLVEEVDAQISETKDFKKAFNDVMRTRGEEFKLSKGTEWGRRLADLLSDKRDTEAKAGWDWQEKLTKIERQILKVLRGSQPNIDFPLSVERVDPKSFEIL